jgi:alpha-N-acetylglucosaminidase
MAVEYPNTTIVGTGLTMEGIFQNYIVYQFVIDRTWSTMIIDEQQWSVMILLDVYLCKFRVRDYARQRYGIVLNDPIIEYAWNQLRISVYNEQIILTKPSDRFVSYVFKRPHFHDGLDVNR